MPYLFVGLGNPGEKYKNTRHNVGRLALEHFVQEHGFSSWRKEKFARGLLCDGEIEGDDISALLPNTYMNRSGESVRKLVRHKEDVKNVVILHDEIDMLLGDMEIAFGKGSGGHNGVKSIIETLGSKDFIRIRIGVSPANWFGNIKKPESGKAVSDFVLSDFKKNEYEKVEELFPRISGALEMTVTKGKSEAMNAFNEKL